MIETMNTNDFLHIMQVHEFQNHNIDSLFHDISTSLIPNICHVIAEFDLPLFEKVPGAIEYIIHELDEDGLVMIKEYVLPTLFDMYTIASSGKRAQPLSDLLVEIIKSIPDEYQSTTLIEVIQCVVSKDECCLRILALKLLNMVKFRKFLCNNLEKLVNDRNQSVRAATIEEFKNGSFKALNSSDREKLLLIALNDQNKQHQETAASFASKFAPNSIDVFMQLITNKSTMRYGLGYLNGFDTSNFNPDKENYTLLFDGMKKNFTDAIVNNPIEGISALIKLAQILKDNEDLMNELFECAMHLSNCTILISNLFSFAQFFTDKTKFVKLLSLQGVPQRNIREMFVKQCILFAPFIPKELVPVAVMYSNDEAAFIRNQSVSLWIEIFKAYPEGIQTCINSLLENGWQQRLIVAKIISAFGMRDEFEEVAEKLSSDEVSNVRYCLARGLAGTSYFEKFFSLSSDPDIISYAQSQ